MSYSATVFNVMIASPGDVASERSIIRDVIYEWNTVHSNPRNIVLLPIGWESHSSPEMGSKPQEIINSQVLNKCDLLVGVFWTRIGTPTTEYDSGSVEEIEKHINSGKPVMLYFSSQPVALDLVDTDQITKVRQFKEYCKDKGLYESYDNHTDFKEKFYRHLQIKLNENQMFRNIKTEAIATVVESKVKLPQLSFEARTLLKEACRDTGGLVLYLKSLNGCIIQTNDRNLIPSREHKEITKWKNALENLVKQGLLIKRGTKNDLFEVSSLGHQVADMIEL